MTCCSGLACVVLVLGLVAVLTFCPLHVPLLLISCFADIIVAAVVSGLVYISVCVTCCICVACVVLFVLWACRGSNIFSPRVPFLLDLMSR